MVWLRIDVDNPCYYHPIFIRLRLRWNVPIPGYYKPTRETLAFLKSKYPELRRIWFIRSIILPPRDLLKGEEIGLHVTNPMNILKEYAKVTSWFDRSISYYTRHGHSKIASGKVWTEEEKKYVRSVLPNLEDLSDKPHHTITRLPDQPSRVDFRGIDHILFHDVHFRIARRELEEVLERVASSA